MKIVRPVADGGPGEEREEAEVRRRSQHVERHAGRGAEEATAPQAEDDRRHGGQQVDQVAERRRRAGAARSAR